MQKKYTISLNKGKVPVIGYMSEHLDFSARQAKKLLKEKKVLINGRMAYRDSKVQEGDLLEVALSEETRAAIEAEAIELEVIYEDEYILAVDKPPFMLVHPTPNHPGGTLLNAVADHFQKQGENIALRLLNRLDMNTSGIVVLPKSAAVHRNLDELMKKGSIRKYYTAVACGVMEPEKGIINQPIGKDDSDPIKRKVMAEGQTAITIYETLRSSREHSLVHLELLTGRTHQIRVHLCYLGHPIVGDTLYGQESQLIARQALHASDMELPHPGGGGSIHLHAGLPADIAKLIADLKLE